MVECEGTCLMYMREMPRCHNSKRRMDLQSVQYSPQWGQPIEHANAIVGTLHMQVLRSKSLLRNALASYSSMLGMYSSTAILGYGVGKKEKLTYAPSM